MPHIEGARHHDALRFQTSTRLQRCDQIPTTIGIGGQIPYQGIHAHACLDVGVRPGGEVLAQISAGLRMPQFGFFGQSDHQAAGDVVQVFHHLVEVRGVVILGDIDTEDIGMEHAICRRIEVAHRVVDAHADGFGITDEFGDGVLHMGIAILALLFTDQLREASHHFSFMVGDDQPQGAFP